MSFQQNNRDKRAGLESPSDSFQKRRCGQYLPMKELHMSRGHAESDLLTGEGAGNDVMLIEVSEWDL